MEAHLRFLRKCDIDRMKNFYDEIVCFLNSEKCKIKIQTICLHCGHRYCIECLREHKKSYKDHFFSLTKEFFEVYCSECGLLSAEETIKIDPNFLEEENEKKRKKNCLQYIETAWKEMKKHETILEKPRTLYNLGNTCYLNSLLQTFAGSLILTEVYSRMTINKNSILYNERTISKEIELFYDEVAEKSDSEAWHVIVAKKEKKTKYSQEQINDCVINQIFQEVLKEMHTKNQTPYSPEMLLKTLSNRYKKYGERQEQDVEELFVELVDILSAGERWGLSKFAERYKSIEAVLGAQKISPLQHIFGCYLVNRIACLNCGKINFTFDLTYHLPVSLSSFKFYESSSIKKKEKIINKITLSEEILRKEREELEKINYGFELEIPNKDIVVPNIFHNFFMEESLTRETNFYECEKCKESFASRRFYLASQPEILVVSHKRFNSKGEKNSEYFPFEKEIDLTGIALTEGIRSYELYSIIVHIGKSMHCGHYVSYVRKGLEWMKISDEIVRRAEWKEVSEQQAYLLFYSKKAIEQYSKKTEK